MTASLLHYMSERFNAELDPNDILSKLSSLDKQVVDNKRTSCACFGLEDSDGNIIKVHVSADQAEEFERALEMAFESDSDQDSGEIAEVLFKLRDSFNITDVEWPKIEEDEEGDATSSGDFQEESPNPEPKEMTAGETDVNPPIDGGSDSQASSALDSVIQAMIANSEASRQESLAKAAEARAREAEAAARMADQKLKSEEEVADMEAFYSTQNEEKKEAKKLAKLASYRHTIQNQHNNTGPFNDAGRGLKNQERDSEERMDKPSGVNPEGTDPSMGPGGDNSDVSAEVDAAGFDENEEQSTHNDIHSRFRDLKSIVGYLNSMRVRRSVHND